MPRIERGEVWLVDLGYVAKIRPFLVLSVPALDSDRALVTVIPHTTQRRGTRFEVAVETSFLARGVFDAQNPVTTSHAKFRDRLGTLTTNQLEQVADTVRLWLGLSTRTNPQ